MFEALGIAVYRRRVFVLVAAALFLACSLASIFRGGRLTTGTIVGLESGDVGHLAALVTGVPVETTLVVVFTSKTLSPDDRGFADALDLALDPIRELPEVARVVTPEDAGDILGKRMRNADRKAAFALVTLAGTQSEALAAYPAVRKKLSSNELTVACTGHIPFVHDLDTTLEHDLVVAEIISLPLAILVLLLVFRSLVAALLPVAVGALAVLGAIAVMLALSHYTDVAQYTINVCSLIGLGVAIDYCLFTVSRYREELALGHDYKTALIQGTARSGRVVAFSGLAVGTGIAGLFFFRGSYLASMGVGGAIVVLLAVVFALTFLPALLAVLGPHIDRGQVRLPAAFGLLSKFSWSDMASWVMKRPVAVLVPTLSLLLLMGVPFAHLKMAAADVTVLSKTTESRAAYDTLHESFPEQAEPVVIAVRFPSVPLLSRERVFALYDLAQRAKQLPHVTRVMSVVSGPWAGTKEATYAAVLQPSEGDAAAIEAEERMSVGDKVVLLRLQLDVSTDSEEAREVVRKLRKERAVADGTLQIGGDVAYDIDTTEFMISRAPFAVLFVVVVTLLMLFALLRSVILPIKAVLMNFVSIAGSFGALVWVFQDGHLFVREPRPVEPTLPVLLFCVLFGLSMDYEVLMLSRMRESYDRTSDNTLAVAEGLEKTAGLITSAAAIMVAVFGAFALAGVVLIRAVGFGMAIAVALDATLVRVLLVPSTMRLFGELNWWAPKFLGGREKLRRK